jgi:hypothetical protein
MLYRMRGTLQSHVSNELEAAEVTQHSLSPSGRSSASRFPFSRPGPLLRHGSMKERKKSRDALFILKTDGFGDSFEFMLRWAFAFFCFLCFFSFCVSFLLFTVRLVSALISFLLLKSSARISARAQIIIAKNNI